MQSRKPTKSDGWVEHREREREREEGGTWWWWKQNIDQNFQVFLLKLYNKQKYLDVIFFEIGN